MSEWAVDVAIGYVFIGQEEGIDDFLTLARGKKPIGIKTDDQEAAPGFSHRLDQTAILSGQVEIIHRLTEIQIGIGVEAIHENCALMVEIGFDAEVSGRISGACLLPKDR